MGIKVPRTRAGDTWTEARYWAFIRSALRGAWQRYPVKYQVLLEGRRVIKGTKNRYEHKCAECKKWHVQKEVQVDHIVPAGSLTCYQHLGGFAERLFCEKKDLQKLCKPCHQIKTNKERADAKAKAARDKAESESEA